MSLKKNTLWNLVGTGVPALVGAITVPYIIRQAGLETFGILTLMWALIGYFSLFDFGLGRVLTQQIASCRGTGMLQKVPSLAKTGLLLTLALGLVGGGLLAALASQLGHRWLNVSQSLQGITVSSMWIASVGIPVSTLTSGLRGILEAYEDFKAANQLRLLLGFANFGFPALTVLMVGPRLDLMAISLVAARFLVLAGHIYFVNARDSRYIRAKLLPKDEIIRLLYSGGYMTVANIISPLMGIADRFIISYVLGASLVAYYTVPFEVLFRVLLLPGAFTAALYPRLASLVATDEDAYKRLYRKGLGIVAAVMFPICFICATGSYLGLKIWLGQDFAQNAWPIASVLAVGVLFNGVAQVPCAALQASGRVRVNAIIHCGELVLYLPLLYLSIKHFGLLGAAIVWAIRVGCDLLVLSLFARERYRPTFHGV